MTENLELSQLTLLVPAFNEEQGISMVIQSIREQFPALKIIVIDDGSTDQTAAILDRIGGIKVIKNRKNRGYGASLKTAMSMVKTPYLMWFDGDGQHNPADIPKVAAPVMATKLDASIGWRTAGSAFTASRAPGKWILRWVSQLVARRKIPDLNCGLRCFRTAVIFRYLHLLPNGFSASSTSTLMIKRGYSVVFTPIETKHRLGKSSVRMVWDGLRTLRLVISIFLLFDSVLFFSACAFVQILLASLYSAYMISTVRLGVPVLGAIGIISGLLTFFIGILASQISHMRQEQFEYAALNRSALSPPDRD